MNIQQAKEEIKNTVKAYLTKNTYRKNPDHGTDCQGM